MPHDRSAFKMLNVFLRNTISGVGDNIPNYANEYFTLP